MKFKAPKHVSSFMHAGVTHAADENGILEVADDEASDSLIRQLGANGFEKIEDAKAPAKPTQPPAPPAPSGN